ncbi:MAG: LptF/LptG family permease, partial [Gemmatimonadales bacterium]
AFGLREQVINEVPPSKYFIRASRIDAATGRLKGVTIYDVGGEASRRIIYADSGSMAYAEGQTDLSLRLYDGSIHQYRPAEPTRFQLTYFTVNDIRVKNVYDELRRNTSESIRGDREMSTCEMLAVVREARQEQVEARRERTELVVHDLRALLALPPIPRRLTVKPDSTAGGYCNWFKVVQELILPGTVEAQAPAQLPSRAGGKVQPPAPPGPTRSPQAAQPTQSPKLRPPPRGKVPLSNWSEVASAADRVREADRRADRFAVEVHKKWAISMACITFVIIGVVLALRFPRGGIGLVIGGGTLIFAIHYIGLTAGESLADRGHMTPWFAMWAPNIVLTVLGLFGVLWVSRQSGSTRGGDLREVFEGLGQVVVRLRRKVFR